MPATEEEPGRYAMPAGHLEFGESLRARLAREFREGMGELADAVERSFTSRGVPAHKIGFHFAVHPLSDVPRPGHEGYGAPRGAAVRLRSPSLSHFRRPSLRPIVLRNLLAEDARHSSRQPTRPLVSQGE